jgi:hypothetical protein
VAHDARVRAPRRLRARQILSRQTVTVTVAFAVAALVAAGGVAGVTVKQHQAPQSLQTVSVGKTSTDRTISPASAADPVPQTTTPAASSPAAPVVAPLTGRVDPDVFLTSPTTITPAQIAAVKRVTGSKRVLSVDYAQVKLGAGITTAVGVDPSTFRRYTPDNTAPVDALWQRVAEGDAVVAHAVGAALGVKLGGHVVVGKTVQSDVRIGAFATSRLPGVGVIVDRSQSAALGLVRGAALIIALPKGSDPLVATAAAQLLMPKAKASALRYVVQTGLTGGATPTGPTIRGGIPILGNGWTIPLALGSYTLTQRYHYPHGHPGIDLAAPWGTPIYAAAEGDVLYWGPAQGFGNWIVLQHPGGIQTVYGHMRRDELIVGPSAHVKAGQLIARVGSEGDSTGPHLHFEVHIDNVRTDPIAFLNAHGVNEIH